MPILDYKLSAHCVIHFKDKVAEKFNDKAVKELESLKKILGENVDDRGSENVISVSKSQISSFTDVNGVKSQEKEITNEVDKNGEMIVKLSHKMDVLKNKEEEPKTAFETEIDIPSKGIHHVIKNDANLETNKEKKEEFVELKNTRKGVDKINSFSKINYNPHDMAEYIFWTGDEKGVALAIEEFLRERLMSRQEAINFLQSIKYSLDLMQSKYKGLGKEEKKFSNKKISNLRHNFVSKNELVEKPKEYLYEDLENAAKLKPADFMKYKPDSSDIMLTDSAEKQSTYLNKLNFVNDESSAVGYFEKKNKSFPKLPEVAKSFDGDSLNDDNYNQIMEKLQMTSLLQKEYSLEEVMFQLSKLMFSESLKNGNTEAQKAMQKFSAYLQNQVDNGQISGNLQKKILEVLTSALMDVLPEHSMHLNHPNDELKIIFNPNSPTSEVLNQLISLGTSRLSAQTIPKEKLSEETILLRKKKLSKEFL